MFNLGCTFPVTTAANASSSSSAREPRVRRLSKALDGSIVMTTTGDHSHADSSNGSTRLKRIWFDMLDNMTCELSSRFGSLNDSLSAAVTALLPGLDNFLSEINLLPLGQLIQQVQQFDVSLFQAELKITGSLINSKIKEEHKNDLQQTAFTVLHTKKHSRHSTFITRQR